jgi:TetR/AcrR family transcriptional regulator, transcriptional repressor for nem operon
MASDMRQRLIDSAAELIFNRGFAGTSVDSICDHAGASKGSFYHFFKSKAEIGSAVLESWFERTRALSEGGPYQTEADPEKRLLGYINHTRNISAALWGRGSVLSAVAVELGDAGAVIPETCTRLIEENSDRTAALFEPVAAGLDFSPTANDLARLFLAVTEGAALLARAEGRPEAAKETFDTFQLCIKRLLEYTRESP